MIQFSHLKQYITMTFTLPFERSYWIIPGKLMAGEYPAVANKKEAYKKLDSLIDKGIKVIINLTEADEQNNEGVKLFEYKDYLKREGVEVHRMPIEDLSIPSKSQMDSILKLIDDSLNNHKPVYFHCWGGVGRTGTVLGCYLRKNEMSSKENIFDMISYLKRTTSISNKMSPENETQKNFVLNYNSLNEKLPIQNYKACLLGGAIGDALGAPIEFMSLSQIIKDFGRVGITDYIEFENNTGEFTDDTQMTLFTAEGLLRSYHREMLKGIGGALNSIVYESYLRWLHTQGYYSRSKLFNNIVNNKEQGWLLKQKELLKTRVPGNTILSSLQNEIAGSIDRPLNDSKGCGTIMKIAPVGLMFYGKNKTAFKFACELSAITHGHPTGYLSAGVFASIISDLAIGIDLKQSIKNAIEILRDWENNSETYIAVEVALNLYEKTKTIGEEISAEMIEQLGKGWVAEEALSMSIYASLIFEDDFENGVLFSVNHSGDSDSTGSITGNILGLINGFDKIPKRWEKNLRGSEIVCEIGEDLHTRFKGDSFNTNIEWWNKYPGF